MNATGSAQVSTFCPSKLYAVMTRTMVIARDGFDVFFFLLRDLTVCGYGRRVENGKTRSAEFLHFFFFCSLPVRNGFVRFPLITLSPYVIS